MHFIVLLFSTLPPPKKYKILFSNDLDGDIMTYFGFYEISGQSLSTNIQFYTKVLMTFKIAVKVWIKVNKPNGDNPSLKAIGCHVSEWFYVSVSLFPNSSETSKPDELKFWGMIPLRMQNVSG